RRDRAGDPAPGCDDRGRLPGPVGDGDRRRGHRLVGRRLPGALDQRPALLMARVFVTGGTGVIGTALVTALLARGDEVVGLARSDASADALRTRGIEAVRGETWDQDAMTTGMQGC